MKKYLLSVAMACSLGIYAQDELIKSINANVSLNAKFNFKEVISLETTSVKTQGSAGTCWSYSGNSFLESEMIKKGKQPVDLAEIYTMRKVHQDKARNYILMNGNMGLGDGAESHDVVNMFAKYGAMPQEAYTYEDYGKGKLSADEFQKGYKEILDNYLKNKNTMPKSAWVKEINDYMDAKLGKLKETFQYKGKTYTPETFAKEVVGLNPDDYIEFSSYSDSPYYNKILMPVPDNWSYELLYNVPMTEITDIIDYSLSKGYTVAWAADVSEAYFSWKNGVAHVPDVKDIYNISPEEKAAIFNGPLKEKEVTEALRLEGLYSLNTTDDHGMHIVGIATDQKGKEYYKVKNSWGTTNDYKGFLYVTKAYVQLKTTAILLNKAGVPKSTKSKLKG